MRDDLLALTPETLAELTNRGLVKRAAREVEREAPALSEDPDGTVHAIAPDGTPTDLPPGALEAGTCGCGAAGVCRHVVGLVLAYRAWAEVVEAPSAEAPAWSPGDFSDDELAGRIGERMMAAARRVERAGYVARVHRGRPGDPVPTVELPSATVRFLVPGNLGLARTDAAAGVRDDVLALAVWAVRAADAQAPGEVDVQVQVGGEARSGARPGPAERGHALGPSEQERGLDQTGHGLDQTGHGLDQTGHGLGAAQTGAAQAERGLGPAEAGRGPGAVGRPGLERAVALAGLALREGAVHLGSGIEAEIAAVRRELESARMRWPLLAVDDLAGQLTAYRERSARYRPEALADHVAELFARHRSVTRGGASLASRVLGTEEAQETPLRRARLDGLGARVTAVGEERVVDVFLAHADGAAVLVLRRAYASGETGPELGERRVAGVRIAALAGGAVITESAARSASRTVRLGTRRLSRTEATTSRGSWQRLPRALIAEDLTALAAELDGLPPRPVRARVEAELVRVVPVAEVISVSYAPGAQRLDAVIADRAGTTAIVTATHAACAPGRLDGVAAALAGDVRYVAGGVRRAGGGVVVDPIGFAVGDGVLVPDLSPARDGSDPHDRPGRTADPLGHAIEEALSLLAEVAHRGLLHAPPTMPLRLRQAAGSLAGVGLRRAGEAATTLAALLGPDPGEEAVIAWADAYLRLSVAAERR